jgi:2'-5' RNA ligase
MNSKRLFLAIAIPPQIRSALAACKVAFSLHGLSWVKEENLHITLLFLGEVEINEMPGIEQKLSSLSDSKPFALQCKEIVPVNRRGKLSMIWASFNQSPEFIDLVTRISAILHHPPDHAPLPHVTLARVKRGQSIKLPPSDMPSIATFQWQVHRFGLWESVLNPQGAVYTVLKEWELRGGI